MDMCFSQDVGEIKKKEKTLITTVHDQYQTFCNLPEPPFLSLVLIFTDVLGGRSIGNCEKLAEEHTQQRSCFGLSYISQQNTNASHETAPSKSN
jgi:hypothetical protein